MTGTVVEWLGSRREGFADAPVTMDLGSTALAERPAAPKAGPPGAW